MRKLKVLLIHDGDGDMPEEKDFAQYESTPEWSTEISVLKAIKSRGHDLRLLNFNTEVSPLIDEMREDAPDIVFNLVETCFGEYLYDKNIPSLLELLKVPYTGCGPAGLMICNDKAVTKKILAYHGIPVPRFCVCRAGEAVKFPGVFNAPYFVKPLQEEASAGIAQRSLADSESRCLERVQFVHEHLKKDAMVEEYIDGRELYIGLMGNGKNIKAFPVWELKFENVPDHEPKIATYRAKWDNNYRKKWGISNECAGPLPDGVEEKVVDICKNAYRALNLDGYARFDLRLTPDGEVYIIEANANPELATGEDFAASAQKAGMVYDELIEKIMHLGMQRKNS